MKTQLKTLALLLLITFGMFTFIGVFFLSSVEGTYVEGHITQDTTWTVVDSPYVVSEDLFVDPNVVLTLEPGVEVRFGGNFTLSVEGTLVAVGTQSQLITFTSNTLNPHGGDWRTIKFNALTDSVLDHVVVKYGLNGVTVENGKLTLRNSEIAENSLDGIDIVNGQVDMENNDVANNLGNGISVMGSNQAVIQNNILRANGVGMLLTGNSTSGLSIYQNTILLNAQSGIKLDAAAYSNISILNNTVSSNNYGLLVSGNAATTISNNSISYNGLGVYYEAGSNHVAHFNDVYGNGIGMDVVASVTVDATRNYWGDKSGPHHLSLNPDGKGDEVGGRGSDLDFIFFLTAPVGNINQRPNAVLRSDVKTVRPSQIVTFFATASSDDGHVDQYFFDFGDGKNSSWTTLSVFVHGYSSVGTHYATVMVMDDFGVRSVNVAAVVIDVQNLASSLTVGLTVGQTVVGAGSQFSIRVRVTDGYTGVASANVTLFSVLGGSFTPVSGFSNATGYLAAMFTAPNSAEKVYVRVTATASKAGYADGSSHENLAVLPILSVDVTVDSAAIKSDATVRVAVHVTHGSSPVPNATVIPVSDSGGVFTPAGGNTNVNGSLEFTFRAPVTTVQLNLTIAVMAQKTDYYEGSSSAKMTVNPRILVVEVASIPSTVESTNATNIMIHVTEDSEPVEGAWITVSSGDYGSFSAMDGTTNANGDLQLDFNSPETSSQLDLTITASATKTGYVGATNQTSLTVKPLPGPAPPSFLGLSLTTLLMIIIPIVVVVIVVVLIKMKIIVISRGDSDEY